MAKDPAFLFYYSNFQHGTRKMTFEEKGAYIELLCEQADSGYLSIDDIKRVLKDSFPIWSSICYKFSKKGELYYNAVLEEHIEKRQKFVKSRKNNLSSQHVGDHKSSHMGKHMVNRNINRDKNEDKRFVPPKIGDVAAYCIQRNNQIDPELFIDHYKTNGWVQSKGKPVKDWKACVRTWEKRGNFPQDQKKSVTGGNVLGVDETDKYLNSMKE